jgi:hypothetical protein
MHRMRGIQSVRQFEDSDPAFSLTGIQKETAADNAANQQNRDWQFSFHKIPCV